VTVAEIAEEGGERTLTRCELVQQFTSSSTIARILKIG